jgi:hypothetical protein
LRNPRTSRRLSVCCGRPLKNRRERNALRAHFVPRAEEWRWSSLWRHCHGTAEERALLATWPTERPPNWVERVNRADDSTELDSLRQSMQKGRPFGQAEWQKQSSRGITHAPNIGPVPLSPTARWALPLFGPGGRSGSCRSHIRRQESASVFTTANRSNGRRVLNPTSAYSTATPPKR